MRSTEREHDTIIGYTPCAPAAQAPPNALAFGLNRVGAILVSQPRLLCYYRINRPVRSCIGRRMTTMLPTAAMKHGVDLASMSSTSFSSAPSSARRKRRILSSVMQRPLDRVKVLGNEHYGHTGCDIRDQHTTLVRTESDIQLCERTVVGEGR